MWLIGGIAVFLLLVYVGRQTRLGRFKPGPWIQQFRVVRGLFATAMMILGVTMLVRGEIWPGLAALLVALILGGSVRFKAAFGNGPRPAPEVAAYSADEIAAYKTLGLAVGADKKAVKAAWKALMKAAHPDQGGSDARAKALNAARDVLLKRRT